MKVRVPLELRVELGDPLVSTQGSQISFGIATEPRDSSCINSGMNMASSRVEVGTSGFLSISNFHLGVSAELELESQASSCVEIWNSAASRVVHGVSDNLSSCICNHRLLPQDATSMSVPLCVVTSSSVLHSKSCLGIGTYIQWTGKWVSFGMWHESRGFLSGLNVKTAFS